MGKKTRNRGVVSLTAQSVCFGAYLAQRFVPPVPTGTFPAGTGVTVFDRNYRNRRHVHFVCALWAKAFAVPRHAAK